MTSTCPAGRHSPQSFISRAILLGVGLLSVGGGVVLRADEPDQATRDGWKEMSQLGRGFVIWESQRSGRWRLYRRELDGTGIRQLSSDEKGRDHFCPHLSPDGSRLVYLSYPADSTTYQTGDPPGGAPLYLMQSDGSGVRKLADRARAYSEDRAAVWIDDRHLIYIDGEGVTREMDLESGKIVPLTKSGLSDAGFLINATKTFATTGTPTFSPFNSAKADIVLQNQLGGCQPYFSHDGRWGFWMGGAGGPINRFDLRTRQVSAILNVDDPRLPPERNYLYFPMVARDGRLFAFAASPDQHDHFTADYDIFVARMDPETLELIGTPVRYSFDKGCDRFPDVYLAPLELGRHANEAPYTVALHSPDNDANWRWDFGDGGISNGAQAQHTYSKPGRYDVTARGHGRTLRGLVNVAPAAPPKVQSAWLYGDREIVVLFDEPIAEGKLEARLDSGTRIAESSVAQDATKLRLQLAARVAKTDTLHLSGIVDRAQSPNALEPQTLRIEPLDWPVNQDGLVFVFQTADQPNLVPDAAGGPARSYAIAPRGKARLDHNQALVLAGGAYLAKGADDALLAACRKSNQLSIEAVIRSDRLDQIGPARIVSFSTDPSSRNFTLGQEKDKLIFRLRTPNAGTNGVNPETTLGSLSAGTPHCVAVTYRPGELVAYVDGKEVYHGQSVQGDFSNWEPQHLIFGDEFGGQRNFAGTLEGVAIYSRVLSADEVERNALRYRTLMRSRHSVPQVEVVAKLVEKSPLPTLEEIKPYRAALVVCKYRVMNVLSGELAKPDVFVAQWALLDGEQQPIAALQPGATVRLTLEPFEENRQLMSHVCKDEFNGDEELDRPRYYDAHPWMPE